MTSKLSHGDSPKSDARLEEEAAAHLAGSASLQLMTELLTRLRDMNFPWWTPEHLRSSFPASDRMRWFTARGDLRQKITTHLTGLAPKAARNKTPDFQADLIDAVIDSGDIDVATFERAFEPSDIAVYGPADEIWKLFRRRMPWDDDRTTHQDVIGWLLGALLADKSTLDGKQRTPILTALAVRTAIDGRVWHTRIPLDVRVEIDAARFRALKEKPNEPFTPAQDLLIATPALIAASVPLKELSAVLDLAGAALGFETPAPPVAQSDRRASVAPPPMVATRASTPPPRAPVTPREPSAEPSAKETPKEATKEPSPKEATREVSSPKEAPTPKEAAPKDASSREPAKEPSSRKSIRPEPLAASARADKSPPAKVEAKPAEPLHKFEDPPTSDEKKEFDELEHTNPWAIPGGLPEPGVTGDDPGRSKKKDF